MIQPPGYAPQPPAKNGFVKPLMIGCGILFVLVLAAGVAVTWFTARVVGSALHDATGAAGIAQGAVKSAEQAAAQAGASPDPAHAAAAGVAMLKALVNGGKGNAHTLSRQELKTYLPASAGSLARTSAESSSGSFSGISGTSATASYGASPNTVSIDITDAANMSGLTALMDILMSVERDDDSGYEKTVELDGTKVHEKWQSADKHAELVGVVGSRFVVAVTGNGVDMGAAEHAFTAVDLAKLSAVAATNAK